QEERARDPLARLQQLLVPQLMTPAQWSALAQEARQAVETAVAAAMARPLPDARGLTEHVFAGGELQRQGGLRPEGWQPQRTVTQARPEAARINRLTAIRRTLDVELAANARLIVFGEDVGPKGGVHGATLGLQDKYGAGRVFDTSLSEEGIIG